MRSNDYEILVEGGLLFAEPKNVIVVDSNGNELVPIVRCKDCKWWDKVDNIDGVNYGTCERKCTAIRKDAFPNENWFCADGKRKEKEDAVN